MTSCRVAGRHHTIQIELELGSKYTEEIGGIRHVKKRSRISSSRVADPPVFYAPHSHAVAPERISHFCHKIRPWQLCKPAPAVNQDQDGVWPWCREGEPELPKLKGQIPVGKDRIGSWERSLDDLTPGEKLCPTGPNNDSIEDEGHRDELCAATTPRGISHLSSGLISDRVSQDLPLRAR